MPWRLFWKMFTRFFSPEVGSSSFVGGPLFFFSTDEVTMSYIHERFTRWWFQTFFSSSLFGEDFQFD